MIHIILHLGINTTQTILKSLCKCRQASGSSHVTIDVGKHAYACRHGIIANALCKNSDNYPKNNTPMCWQASTQTWEEICLNCLHSFWNSVKLLQTKYNQKRPGLVIAHLLWQCVSVHCFVTSDRMFSQSLLQCAITRIKISPDPHISRKNLQRRPKLAVFPQKMLNSKNTCRFFRSRPFSFQIQWCQPRSNKSSPWLLQSKFLTDTRVHHTLFPLKRNLHLSPCRGCFFQWALELSINL